MIITPANSYSFSAVICPDCGRPAVRMERLDRAYLVERLAIDPEGRPAQFEPHPCMGLLSMFDRLIEAIGYFDTDEESESAGGET